MKQLKGHSCHHCHNRKDDVRMSHYYADTTKKYVTRYLCKKCRELFVKDDESYVRDKNGNLKIWEMGKD